jgi:hypothetical protein
MIMNKRTINFVTVAIPLVVMAVAWLATPATVKGQEAEIEAARKKIEVLLKKAERLQDEGAADKAERLVKQAQDLKARLAKVYEDRPRKKSGGKLGEILPGLKAGAASLRALGRREEAEKLERLAAELRKKAAAGGKRRQGESEREVALGQIRIMRIALQGLLDAGREDSAELMEHAIHAQELALKGIRNKKAIAVRESAPNLGQRVELLMFAARKLRDAGKKEQASAVANYGEQLLERFRAQQKKGGESEQRERRREGGGKERKVAAAQIAVMRTALVALREGEREDRADLLKRAIQARQVRLARLKGEKAEIVLEREPNLGQTVEALALAAKLWRKFGHQKNTAAVRQLAEKLAGSERAKKERPEKREGLQRLKQLEEEVAKLKAALDKRLGELKELQRKLDR